MISLFLIHPEFALVWNSDLIFLRSIWGMLRRQSGQGLVLAWMQGWGVGGGEGDTQALPVRWNHRKRSGVGEDVSSVLDRLRLGCQGTSWGGILGLGLPDAQLRACGQAFSGGHCSGASVPSLPQPGHQPGASASPRPRPRDAPELWGLLSLPQAPATLCTFLCYYDFIKFIFLL